MELLDVPDENMESIGEENEYSPGTPCNTNDNLSQPEHEEFPNGSEPNRSDEGDVEQDDGEEVKELNPVEVPIPDDDDDLVVEDDCCFGDDLGISGGQQGVWEITLNDQ